MAVTWSYNCNLTVAGARLIDKTVTITGGLHLVFNEAIPIATDTQMAFTADVSQVKGVIIYSDVACTIETNANNAAGGQTITLAAGIPYVWINGMGTTNPLTPDITTIFVTSAATGTLEIYKLEDPTV